MAIYAPYNFVPLSRWIFSPSWAHRVSNDVPFEKGINGTLKLKITAHTPILIGSGAPKGKEKMEDGVKVVEFYRLPDGRAAIPGSTMKGMIRNVLEIACYGKMQFVDNKRYAIRDLTNPAKEYYRDILIKRGVKAGWLRFVDEGNTGKRQWRLTPCKFTRIHHDDLCQYFDITPKRWRELDTAAERYYNLGLKSLTFEIKPAKNGTLAYQLGEGTKQGTLVMTGQPSDKKKKEFIFYGSESESIPIPADVMQDFMFIHKDGAEWAYWTRV